MYELQNLVLAKLFQAKITEKCYQQIVTQDMLMCGILQLYQRSTNNGYVHEHREYFLTYPNRNPTHSWVSAQSHFWYYVHAATISSYQMHGFHKWDT